MAPVFEQNGWTWAPCTSKNTVDDDYIPDEEDIARVLKGFKKDIKKDKSMHETGRLFAKWNDSLNRVDYYIAVDV